MKIYDILGQETATLVSDKLNAGAYKMTWDAMGVAKGVYFYKLHAGDYKETKRLLLVR